MIKTVIRDDDNLFTEVTVTVFSNDHGFRSPSRKTLRVAPLANSLTWKYSINDEGKVSFYRIDRLGDYHDESEVCPGSGSTDDIYVGDYLWFKSEGKFSTWGIMIPPKNPARKALWENSYFVPKQSCRFELSRKQFDIIIDRWIEEQDKYTDKDFRLMDIKHVYGGHEFPIVSALIRRSWSNQLWRIVEIAAVEGVNGDNLYSSTIKICNMVNAMNWNKGKKTHNDPDASEAG